MTKINSIADYKAPKNLLAGKIILVTGAGDGIGNEAAITFARHGATVILVGRTLKKLERTYDQIEQEKLPQAAIFPINLESAVAEDYNNLSRVIRTEFGHLDGLLLNAGELGAKTPIHQYADDIWLKTMQVNLNSSFYLTKYLLPLLEQSAQASVLFTGSSVGLKGRAYWGAYAASKAAQENLMQTLHDEYETEEKLRFNSINPGATRTSMRAKAYPAEDPKSVKTPAALMQYYLYLIGPDSQAISGQQFNYS